jgi:three-Cys-motif partner protein
MAGHVTAAVADVSLRPCTCRAASKQINEYRGSAKVNALPGTFEANIPDILRSVGPAFAFFFIDPTGWTGFRMEAIKPVLSHRPGDVIINFMIGFPVID